MKKEKPNILFAVAADNWKNDILSIRKESGYRSGSWLARHLIEEFGHKKIQSITKEDIQKYIVRLSIQVGTGQIKHLLGVFRGIMEYADEDWEMPTRLKLPKAKRPNQPFYTFEEVRKLLYHSSGVEKILIMTLFETGCRLGEALALQTGDIKEGKISITKNVFRGIIQDTPKTDSSIREVSISDRLEKELRSLCLSNPKSFVFRSPSGTRAYWPLTFGNKLKEISKNAGVEYKGSHAFRRGNITELCNTLAIPERVVGCRVGHLSGGTTLGVYVQPMKGQDKKWLPKIEALLYEGREE